MNVVIGVMARAPSSGGKTRLAPHLSPSRLASLRIALLADTLHALAEVPGVTIFCTPDDAASEVAALAGPAVPLVPQAGGDLGSRMLDALRHLLDGPRDEAAILIGSDIPLLTADHLDEAAALLVPPSRAKAAPEPSTPSAKALAERSIVVGPADDGGYYLIGMRQPHAALFEGIQWGTESVLTDTLRIAERIGVEARLARSAYDVDTPDDLLRLERDLKWAPSVLAPAMRRWFSES